MTPDTPSSEIQPSYAPRRDRRGLRRGGSLLLFTVWALAMLWLVRFEAFPGWFADAMTGYRGLLSRGVLVSDDWMKIEFGGQQVGYSHTQVDTHEKDPVLQYEMTSLTYLELNLMGEVQQVRVTGGASLDAFYNLQKFTFALFSRNYRMRIAGDRIKGTLFKVQIRTDAGSQVMEVHVPDDALVYSPMLELSLKQLPIGKSMRVRLFEPLSLRVEDVMVKALRRESLTHNGETVAATLLETDYQGMKVLSWMNADGRILKQVTPLGWTLVACSAAEALDFESGEGLGSDLLQAMAVPCRGLIPEPRNARHLRLRIEGWQRDPAELASDRQTVLVEEDGLVHLEVNVPGWPDAMGEEVLSAAEREHALESTAFVQSQHPDIVRQARRIVGDSQDPLEQARLLHDWVYRRIAKNPAVSLPSALDVLKTREGDCNEHTYLYVALARALNLPALIKVGLVYNDGAFYYHAWPAVHLGQWVELDPTFGQPVADATHLALLDGEIGDQMKLLAVVGRVKIAVLDEKEATEP